MLSFVIGLFIGLLIMAPVIALVLIARAVQKTTPRNRSFATSEQFAHAFASHPARLGRDPSF
ncbi:hypothetical protein [Pseudodonghicola flavimaris]|uniref:Uncharacterized protein n=1 Tax=Pseudodonghicola flavimaris TaxID=3050036 RepID=A0ABT7EV72_9RHOB|nr:hypothetical protein [Pseudodonghicola flavimaris]MDK3016247.1 hypothetical protein [Pseudodonghicola flavimaris]